MGEVGSLSALSAAEKLRLSQYLKSTRNDLLAVVSGLSPEQWEFKPAAERWSIAEVFEHLVIVEGAVHMRIGAIADGAPDDAARAVQEMDELILTEVPQRKQKFEAPPTSHPRHQWTHAEMVSRFQQARERTLELLETASHLRGRVLAHPVMGPWDGYQWILGGAAHGARHMAQIVEIKDHPSFPKRAEATAS